ncbi:helix-turn-helix transcriptional regulator [Paraburkholderia xenovorans]|uniref:helix-turn-helix transcriptional regulator n=1 Tax=Paraburkholderia xenovorans TaxID=36873 RepID=UPI00155976C5|nr:AlpA family transcriptional regulator [Paraburkholderia xenovorans]NPT36309.1 AlpA family phage regulatory protein [Paraburkholderia xenovorans]
MNEKHAAVQDKLTSYEQRQLVRILRRPEVERVTGISRSLIYQLVKAGSFPKPVRLTANRVGWIAGEIEDWLQAKAALRRLK